MIILINGEHVDGGRRYEQSDEGGREEEEEEKLGFFFITINNKISTNTNKFKYLFPFHSNR